MENKSKKIILLLFCICFYLAGIVALLIALLSKANILLWAGVCFVVGTILLVFTIRAFRWSKTVEAYQHAVGKKDAVSLEWLSKTVGKPYMTVCADLEKLVKNGVLKGRIDREAGRFVVREPKKENRFVEMLHEIEYTKSQILNSAVVEKIAEIQRLTEELMMAAGNSIKECREIERFLNKYMPATARFIDAYHLCERQTVRGENITKTMWEIELILDKIIEGFESEIDDLFADNALDISAEIDVLETLLAKDGLSGDFIKTK